LALAFSLLRNHPFDGGNKRVAALCLEDFLELNRVGFDAGNEGPERVILAMAANGIGRDDFQSWIDAHVVTEWDSPAAYEEMGEF
jgi:prophage maintenance system killer protein